MKFGFVAKHRGGLAGQSAVRGARCLARRPLRLAHMAQEPA